MVYGQPDPNMNENKSKDNDKQTESNKDSPAIVTDLPTLLLEAFFLTYSLYKTDLKNNWQEGGWEHKNTAGRFGRLLRVTKC